MVRKVHGTNRPWYEKSGIPRHLFLDFIYRGAAISRRNLQLGNLGLNPRPPDNTNLAYCYGDHRVSDSTQQSTTVRVTNCFYCRPILYCMQSQSQFNTMVFLVSADSIVLEAPISMPTWRWAATKPQNRPMQCWQRDDNNFTCAQKPTRIAAALAYREEPDRKKDEWMNQKQKVD